MTGVFSNLDARRTANQTADGTTISGPGGRQFRRGYYVCRLLWTGWFGGAEHDAVHSSNSAAPAYPELQGER
jgi:hypothetical protein